LREDVLIPAFAPERAQLQHDAISNSGAVLLMKSNSGNLFAEIAASRAAEQVTELLAAPGLRIERIVSRGQTTPPGKWLDQDRAEWVILLRGAARLRFEDDRGAREMRPGDHVTIPAHCRHRVDWTAPDEPTIWLAIHYPA
jgi:cupin 2 domain-containing protein